LGQLLDDLAVSPGSIGILDRFNYPYLAMVYADDLAKVLAHEFSDPNILWFIRAGCLHNGDVGLSVKQHSSHL
jgi:hypothetical protein